MSAQVCPIVFGQDVCKHYLYTSLDTNECAGSNACGHNADCVDTDGSYWCQCLPGFQGDGYNCTGQSHKLSPPPVIIQVKIIFRHQ